ncbi:hypothetical protein A2634_04310 [Candidatus Amesbacteria bacterium RIFCSPHIGHO2_01_FULL_48_32]|uniref:Uncharacterized protein n=1 Tax=Candidatus Amesbacteria bacterium RIFCSPLOWO2_01_FULL_48_25 TaxID=1797259 RepID=A0A1F4ZEK6_9BACT|nr:MAG: hypothetical protein A2634_04310 [Candidatus Amesbacteria bacterium RIFCSPHIGHO2_01_FULL_48_32]OGD03874.1 MAG: hypothetical protein A2989_04195 [Candidatus Amesbacteria bacterium RIFCSPLOWO2_01_FULL_48_25]HJZ05463.1 hypothetical protein [Patescibacteria group bacterium]
MGRSQNASIYFFSNFLILFREVFQESQSEVEAKAKLDYRLIDEVLSLTTNTYQTYTEAPDFLKKHYLRLFFERIYVKDKKVWKIAENPVFSVLRKQQEVIIRGDWLAVYKKCRTSFD